MKVEINGLNFDILDIDELIVDEILVLLIQEATEKALNKLFKEHKEKFYYITLTTVELGRCPTLTAWSEEALEKKVDKDKEELRWSYADSPYWAYGYEEYFLDLAYVFQKRMEALKTDEEIDEEIQLRINSMEKAMFNLDKKGMFGEGKERFKIFINAEYMPPEPANIVRALRLNPREALTEWLTEEMLEGFKEHLDTIRYNLIQEIGYL